MSLSLEQQIEALRDLYRSERDPDGRAFAPLADAYRRAGLVKEALALLREGLAELPDFTTGHVVAARVYVDTGLMAEAELSARRALELDPENALALETLAVALETRGAVDEAREVRERLAALEAPSGWSAAEQDGPIQPWEEARAGVAETSSEADDEVVEIEALLADGAQEPDEAALARESGDEEVVDIEVLLAEGAQEPEAEVLEPEGVDDEVVDVDALLAEEPHEPGMGAIEAEVMADEAMDIEVLLADASRGPDVAAVVEEAQGEGVVGIDDLLAAEVPAVPVDFGEGSLADELVDLEALLVEAQQGPELSAIGAETADEVIGIDDLLAREAEVLDAAEAEAEAETGEVVDIDQLLPGGVATPASMAFDADDEVGRDDEVVVGQEASATDLTDLGAEPRPDQVVETVDLLPSEDLTPDAAEPGAAAEAQNETEEVVGIDALLAEATSSFGVAASSELEDAPREAVPASGGQRPEEAELPSDDLGDGLPVVTRTLAELFVAQGLTDRAIGVYRQLVTAFPDDGLLESRLAELEEYAAGSFEPEVAQMADRYHGSDDSERAGEALDEDDVSDHAWHVGAHEQRHDVDTPFAWTDTEPDERPSSPAISAYFEQLLSWDPSGASDPRRQRDEESPGGGLEEERNGEDR